MTWNWLWSHVLLLTQECGLSDGLNMDNLKSLWYCAVKTKHDQDSMYPCSHSNFSCGTCLQLFVLKTAATGIGPFNRKWRGFFEQGNE